MIVYLGLADKPYVVSHYGQIRKHGPIALDVRPKDFFVACHSSGPCYYIRVPGIHSWATRAW